ncbi:diguanylate cyclase [Streptomyces ruber]|uniref:protein-serine/threonine phosphatase n=2 Tax=Streptomyces TaxID=1883 RepID=A0A918BCF8_9ACTN|nr:SpoIIE family protein phosphatase [Streptomyces ruber]GGQ59349.1 diguanylate cyclase [Streptomyces ruber]
MHGSTERAGPAAGSPRAVLTAAVTDALRAVGGCAGGVYLRTSTPGLLRVSVLAGVPGPLFRPWWQLTVDRPFPVADAHRTGSPVVLADATETMRRYPQLAAGLPFRFGSVYVPVVGGSTRYGVLTVLRPSASDTADTFTGGDGLRRLAAVADRLGAGLLALQRAGAEVAWDGEPLCVRPPAAAEPPVGRVGHFTWDPARAAVTVDDTLRDLAGVPDATGDGGTTCTPERLAAAVASGDAPLLLSALRDAAAGLPAGGPLLVRAADGAPRLFECRARSGPPLVDGLVIDPGPGPAAAAATDLLPDGVFAFDRLGLITYVNPRAAALLGRPREELVGRPLWEAVPWLDRPAYEDHLRGALLSPDPVTFHVRRPLGDGTAGVPLGPQRHGGDWLTLSAHPGPDLVTCRLVPLGQVADTATVPPVDEARTTAGTASLAPVYRPIALAIALSEAMTAQQVSEVVTRELLPAFGGRRLAIFLLHERHLYLAWESGFPKGFLARISGSPLDAPLPGAHTLTTGRALFFESMEHLSAAYPGMQLESSLGSRVFLPLIASGRPVGTCIIGFDRPRRFTGEERTVLTALGGLIAQALERARRYETEAGLARGLQQVLLPHRLPAHPLVETAGRYLPGTQGIDVGGDWYDVVEAGDGLALVIGDVQGRGVQAAATMGQLRSAVRAFALGDHSPDEVMSSTNRLLIDLDPGQFATCCYVRLDPVSGTALATRAGHPQPLLRHPDGRTDVLGLPGGVVLGVDPDAYYPVTELRLGPGAVLALFTDGLVERPDADIDEGVEDLRAGLSRAGAPTGGPQGGFLAALADTLTEDARRRTARPDDIALLLARRRDG